MKKTPASTDDVQLGSTEAGQNGGGGLLIDSVISEYDLAEQFELKKKKLSLLQAKKRLKEELPHKYGFTMYQWQVDYQNARYNKNRFMTAANQVGKSTVQIAECIEMATNISLWSSMWRRPPRVFFYFYPNSQTLMREFESKWVPDLLPRGSLKNHPVYGWKVEKNNGVVSALKFNSGVTVYFLSYSMSVMNLQASTVDAIFADEELPENYWDELNFRRKATNGYFSMVFTATLGQQLWYETMERQGESDERFPTAWKKQVSLYDCKFYSDGTPSHVDDEYIQSAIAFCKNEAEVQKRVYGRFALDSGLKYPQFDRARHVIAPRPIDPRWELFAGVDIGAGGSDNHPSTIVFVAVNPDYTKAEVFEAWKGDKQVTTDMDVYEKLMEMMGDRVFTVFYDYHAKDFSTICKRRGLPVLKADKRHDVGESVINVLFKTNALHLHNTPEIEALTYELTTLQSSTDKRKAKDDLTDALRYALTRIPFSWEKMGIALKEKQQPLSPEYSEDELYQMERRRRGRLEASEYTFEDELQEWADMYDV